jgi:hypothetical protein
MLLKGRTDGKSKSGSFKSTDTAAPVEECNCSLPELESLFCNNLTDGGISNLLHVFTTIPVIITALKCTKDPNQHRITNSESSQLTSSQVRVMYHTIFSIAGDLDPSLFGSCTSISTAARWQSPPSRPKPWLEILQQLQARSQTQFLNQKVKMWMYDENTFRVELSHGQETHK